VQVQVVARHSIIPAAIFVKSLREIAVGVSRRIHYAGLDIDLDFVDIRLVQVDRPALWRAVGGGLNMLQVVLAFLDYRLGLF
jgi:hypothetical protein